AHIRRRTFLLGPGGRPTARRLPASDRFRPHARPSARSGGGGADRGPPASRGLSPRYGRLGSDRARGARAAAGPARAGVSARSAGDSSAGRGLRRLATGRATRAVERARRRERPGPAQPARGLAPLQVRDRALRPRSGPPVSTQVVTVPDGNPPAGGDPAL